MRLWTVYLDYAATGSGRSLMAFIGHAETAEEALEAFGREFNPYFATGAEALEGVHENDVTRALFSADAIDRARQMEGRATFELSARCLYNFS